MQNETHRKRDSEIDFNSVTNEWLTLASEIGDNAKCFELNIQVGFVVVFFLLKEWTRNVLWMKFSLARRRSSFSIEHKEIS